MKTRCSDPTADVSRVLPKATRVAWSLKKSEIQHDEPGITRRRFLFNLSRASYRKRWGKNYQRPTMGEDFLAFLFRILPKIGPLRVLQLKTPTPATERMFEASFNAALSRYRNLLKQVGATGRADLPNDNFDTGGFTGPGIYKLDDETQGKLLDRLAKQNFSGAPPEIRTELLEYFGQPYAPYAMKGDEKTWEQVQTDLNQLKSAAAPSVSTSDPQPTPATGP